MSFLRQLLRMGLAGSALTLAGSACSNETASSVPAVKTDLVKLGKYVRLPLGITGARWLVRAVRPPGSSPLPGPTDAVLVAYLQTSPNFWTEQGHLFGARSPSKRRLRVEDARALLPPDVLGAAALRSDGYELTCETLGSAVLSTEIRKVTASRCGNGILLSLLLQ